MPIHADMAGLFGDALEPAADSRKAGEVKPAFVCNVRIGVKRNIRDGIAVCHEESMAFEVLFHHAERAVALLHPVLDGMHLQLAPTLDEYQPEMRSAQVGLEAVLLEEHPLQHVAAIEPVVRYEGRSAGKVPKNGAGFRQVAPRRSFEQRNMSARVLGKELRRARLAFEDVDLDEIVLKGELCECKPHLVAIARALHRIEREHKLCPSLVSAPFSPRASSQKSATT